MARIVRADERGRNATKFDLGAVLRATLDAVADATLAQTGLPVVKQPGGASTRFSIDPPSQGLPVMVAHEHEVHLWLEAGDGWVVHETAEDTEELFEVWKDRWRSLIGSHRAQRLRRV